MSTKLELVFLTNTGKNATIRITDPKANLTKDDAYAAMDTIIEKNVFAYGGGELIEKVCARINSVTELV